MKCQQCGKERPIKWRPFPFCSEKCRDDNGREHSEVHHVHPREGGGEVADA